MLAAQERMRAAAAKKGASLAGNIQAGDLVMVSSEALLSPSQRDRPSAKLAFKWQGPFRVLSKLSAATFRLDLEGLKAHPVINARFLRKRVENDFVDRLPDVPDPVAGLSEAPELVVEEILSHKKSRHTPPRFSFVVKWEGLGIGQQTVEPLASLVDLADDGSTISTVCEALLQYAKTHADVAAELLKGGFDVSE